MLGTTPSGPSSYCHGCPGFRCVCLGYTWVALGECLAWPRAPFRRYAVNTSLIGSEFASLRIRPVEKAPGSMLERLVGAEYRGFRWAYRYAWAQRGLLILATASKAPPALESMGRGSFVRRASRSRDSAERAYRDVFMAYRPQSFPDPCRVRCDRAHVRTATAAAGFP